MKRKNMTKVLAGALVAAMCGGMLAGCGSSSSATETADGSAASAASTASAEGEVTISFPTSWVGVSVGTEWFNDRMEAFNAEYGGKIKVDIEEIAGDQAYVDKMKTLYTSNSLPDVISTGGYNLIDSMSDQMVDLTDYIDEDFRNSLYENGWEVNSRDGKIYGIPYSRQIIGYYYNKELFAQAGIEAAPTTWEEFFDVCDKLLAAGITPLSMDTADSGWCTSLLLGAMIAQTDEGEEFMNTLLPTDYNTEEFINAAAMIQELFQKYTTSNAVGGAYEDAASNFFMGNTAMIANGPWMVSDFYDDTMVEAGFADKIGTAAFPGNVMYNSGKIGFNIAAKSEETIEAAVTFCEFLTSAESQTKMLEIMGEVPVNKEAASDEVYPLVNEVIENGNNAARNINDFQSLWYANVVDEISVQYPLLAQGEITPEQFAQALTDAAKKNVE
ncbi:MAG: extracellular solute-binding protein [Lachnospiraceae bacterium]|nr:extracellular solute-binding protein [Lachnospiraceae bacterium]